MGGQRGASASAGTRTGNKDLVRYLAARERGLVRRAAGRGRNTANLAWELGEEKATLPVKNQSCELSGQSRATFLMTFSPDGTLIASTHGDHTVRVTDVQSGRCRHILTGHPRTPWCIAFHPASNDILASGCLKGEVRIWDLRGGGSERWASEDGSVIASVTFHPTDQVLVIATGHELLFWDWTRPEPFARCKTASKYERVKWVKFDPLGHQLFTAIANTTVPRETDNQRGGVSYINRDPSDTDERRRLRQRYTQLVQQITTHQRDRVLPADQLGGATEPRPEEEGEEVVVERAGGRGDQPMEDGRNDDHNTSTSHIAGMTFSGPHHADMVIVEPQSPVHVEAVETAREYASMVTRSSALSLSGARRYAADVTSASLSAAANEDVEREVIRVRNDHALEEDEEEEEEQPMEAERDGSLIGYQENRAYMENLDRHQALGVSGSLESQSQGSVWESRADPRPAVPSRHSSLSEQQLSTLLTSQMPLPVHSRSSHHRHHHHHHQHQGDQQSMVMATPTRHERNEPQDSILGSLITSTQMAQVHPIGANSVSSTQTTSGAVTSQPVLPPVTSASSGGAFTSILRARLTTTSMTATQSGTGLRSTSGSSQAAPRTSNSSAGSWPTSMSLLRSQLSHQPTTSSTAGPAPVVTTPSSSSSSSQPSFSSNPCSLPSSLSSAFTYTHPESAPRVSSLLRPTPTTLTTTSTTTPAHAAPASASSSSSSSSTLQAILQGTTEPAVSAAQTAAAGSDAARCLVCGHHAVYQSPNSSSHHQHILHAPQPVPAPRANPNPLDAAAITAAAVTSAPSSTSSSSSSSSWVTSCTSRSSRTGRSRRRIHETHRLAAFFESEMRQAIERVRARQLDIRETLQALDQLQTETGADGGASATAPAAPAGSTPGQTAAAAAARAAAVARQAETTRLNLALQSEELLADQLDLSGLLADTAATRPDSAHDTTPASSTSSHPPSSPTTSSTVAALQALAAQPALQTGTGSSGSQGTSAVTMLSDELNRRIEHLNQLERNVSEITQRLGVRMRSLNERRRRDLGRLRNRISNTQYSLSARLRERQDRLRAHLDEIRRRYRAPGAPRVIPEITVTPSPDDNGASSAPSTVSEAEAELRGLQESLGQEEPLPPTVQWSRNMNRDIETMRVEMVRRRQRERERERTWHTLQRRHLHPHYAVSILDDTINRQNDGLQAAINRAIAGAFMGTGEAAVASNIVNLTHRIQSWDFTRCHIPDISDGTTNVLVPHCKLHNDASVDISQDGHYLATFVPSHRGFPDDTILGVFSLNPDTMGQCLYTKSFGPNAISLSLSPLSNYVLVGLAAKRLAWVFTPKQMVAQVYKLKTPQAGEDSMEHICDLMHPCDLDIRSHISVNSARWLPRVGEGVVYGTNRGDLHICRPGDDESDHKSARNVEAEGSESHSIRRNIMQMLGIAVPSTTSTSTQTIHRLRRTASTQTDAPAAGDEP